MWFLNPKDFFPSSSISELIWSSSDAVNTTSCCARRLCDRTVRQQDVLRVFCLPGLKVVCCSLISPLQDDNVTLKEIMIKALPSPTYSFSASFCHWCCSFQGWKDIRFVRPRLTSGGFEQQQPPTWKPLHIHLHDPLPARNSGEGWAKIAIFLEKTENHCDAVAGPDKNWWGNKSQQFPFRYPFPFSFFLISVLLFISLFFRERGDSDNLQISPLLRSFDLHIPKKFQKKK